MSSDPSAPLRAQPSFNHAATQTELSYFEDKETKSSNSRESAVPELNSPAKPSADLPEEKVDHSLNFDHNETSHTEQFAPQEVPAQDNLTLPNFRDNSSHDNSPRE